MRLLVAGALANIFLMSPVALAQNESAQPAIAAEDLPSIEENNSGKLALKELQAFVNAFTQIRKTYVEEVDDKK